LHAEHPAAQSIERFGKRKNAPQAAQYHESLYSTITKKMKDFFNPKFFLFSTESTERHGGQQI